MTNGICAAHSQLLFSYCHLRLTQSQHLRQFGLHLRVGGIGDGQHIGVELFHLVTGGEGGHIHLVAMAPDSSSGMRATLRIFS